MRFLSSYWNGCHDDISWRTKDTPNTVHKCTTKQLHFTNLINNKQSLTVTYNQRPSYAYNTIIHVYTGINTELPVLVLCWRVGKATCSNDSILTEYLPTVGLLSLKGVPSDTRPLNK